MAQNPSITGILIGIVFVSLFAGIFGLFLGEMGRNYDITSIDNTSLEKYNKMNEMYEESEKYKTDITGVNPGETGIADVLGGFFFNAYQVLASIPRSINFIFDMSTDAINDLNLGTGGILLRNALLTILSIVIFIGIILSILLKRDGL